MPSSNLLVTSASTNGAGQRILIVAPSADLWLKELIVVPFGTLPSPLGVVTPGTQNSPVVRTIFVDKNDPVLTRPAPFTLALSYDAAFHLVGPIVELLIGALEPVLPPFDFSQVGGFKPDQAAMFVTQALAAAAPVLSGGGIAPLAAAAAGQALPGNGHAATPHKNGHEKHQHAK